MNRALAPQTAPYAVAWFLIALGAAACGDPLKSPQLIEEPRVIGARVEVDGAAERAWPAPGEAATVRWLVGTPVAPAAMTAGLLVCPGLPESMGVPDCAGAPFAAEVRSEPATAEPALHFELPGAAALADVDRVLALAVLCPAGEPILRGSLPESGCSDPDVRPLRASFEIGIARDGADNQNPDLAAAHVELDGESWEPARPADVAGAPCGSDDALLAVAAGSGKHLLSLTVAAGDREALHSDNPLDPPRESLQLSFLTTAGELDHPYAFLEADATSDRVEVAWEAPKRVAEGGEIARFYWVARDLRGGADWAERAVCVTP